MRSATLDADKSAAESWNKFQQSKAAAPQGNRLRRSGFLLTLLAGMARADTPPLTQPEMQQVLRTLQTQFAQPDAVNFESLNRAAIAGLLRDHPAMMQLVTVPDTLPAVPALVVEPLTPRIACVRPHSFRKEDADAQRAALTKLTVGESSALILDLRAPAPDSDPAFAAEFASLFLPKGTAISGTVKTTADPAWTRDLVVLTDSETTNTGEVLATILKSKQRAFLIGGNTRGRTAAVADLPLRKVDGGQLVLHYTAQRVVFPEGVPDPFGKGLAPDMPASLDADAKAKVFALQAKEGLARGVFNMARPRTNEAALVAKTNPELPERIARTAGQPSEYDTQLTDRPLQLAVDILTARAVLTPAEGK